MDSLKMLLVWRSQALRVLQAFSIAKTCEDRSRKEVLSDEYTHDTLWVEKSSKISQENCGFL